MHAQAERDILQERQAQIGTAGDGRALACEKASLAGSVSQRACTFCGSRVVLYPIVDALHLIHGPVGCAAYTWDIRGATSSGPRLHRMSFSTDLGETEVIFGGEEKLARALRELIKAHRPKAAFVYATCITGLIGDDVHAVCRTLAQETGIPVLPVDSEGFKGTKKDGYRAACEAIGALVGTAEPGPRTRPRINILGDFNIAGETAIVRSYYEAMGLEVVATITGDGRVDAIRRAHGADLNVVQCSGSMTHLAKVMQERYGIPFLRVSYVGIEDTGKALYDVAEHFGETGVLERTQALVHRELSRVLPELHALRANLEGKRAAVYTGGAFKAFSLIRSLRNLGMRTVLVGSQTGSRDDYEGLKELCDPGTIIVDDTNPVEIARFIRQTRPHVFIGGVKERPVAHKMGVGFCDHNHERKIPLAGFEGMLAFAREVHATVTSPVWRFVPRPRTEDTA